MKWLTVILLALTMTLMLSFGLTVVFKSPTSSDKINQPSIEFVDITFDQRERGEIDGKIRALINQVQVCQTAKDCVKTSYGCPFGCSNLMNKTNDKQILELKTARALTTGIGCMYRCTAPPQGSPACIDNICSLVETIDGKRDIRQFIKTQLKAPINSEF